MRIGRFTPVNGEIKDIVLNRPLHKVLFRFKGQTGDDISAPNFHGFFYDTAPMILRMDLQDNDTGAITPVVPHLNLQTLSEIASRREGFAFGRFFMDESTLTADYEMSYPVVLAPAGNMDLDANKFILGRLSGIPSDVTEVEVYGIELDTISAIIVKYEKFNIAKGINRQRFTAQGQLLVLPTEGFEEIQVTYRGGVVTVKTLYELQYLTAMNNDIVSAIMQGGIDRWGFSTSSGLMRSGTFGFQNALVLDLDGVQEFEVIRDNTQLTADQFDLVMVDLGQDRLTNATLQRLAGGSIRTALNTDGTVSLIGAERVRVGNPLDQTVTRLPAEMLAMGGVSIAALI